MEVQIVLDSEVQIGPDSESQPIEIPHFLAVHNLRPFLTQTILSYCQPLWFQTGTDGKPLRVLSRRKFQQAIGRNFTAPKDVIVQLGCNQETQPVEIPHFLSAQNLRPFLTQSVFPYGSTNGLRSPVATY